MKPNATMNIPVTTTGMEVCPGVPGTSIAHKLQRGVDAMRVVAGRMKKNSIIITCDPDGIAQTYCMDCYAVLVKECRK